LKCEDWPHGSLNLRQQLIIAWGDGELPEEAIHIPTYNHTSSTLLWELGRFVFLNFIRKRSLA